MAFAPHSSSPEIPNLVALTGAGISVESGLGTFRGGDALCSSYSFERKMTRQVWERDPEVVLELYNRRRAELEKVQPNEAHRILAELEQRYRVTVITQNIDDLHERAGSSNVIHLHGSLCQARSVKDEAHVVDIGYRPIYLGDLCPAGGQLRPNVVWFGENVLYLQEAAEAFSRADLCIVVGTSLQVQPAAALLDFLPDEARVYVVDPSPPRQFKEGRKMRLFKSNAVAGMREIRNELDRLYRG
ncbi:MAG: Sir2 family NAD-dependent protein deacetylase [Verrucomicrobiota bacterium JB022]|nr:Sir2 family NAD-dependent protein deacetylase [Verrucomicrobiota bacterium JB022]